MSHDDDMSYLSGDNETPALPFPIPHPDNGLTQSTADISLTPSSADIAPFGILASDDSTNPSTPGALNASLLSEYKKIHQEVRNTTLGVAHPALYGLPIAVPIMSQRNMDSDTVLPVSSPPISTTSTKAKISSHPSMPTIIANNNTGHTDVIFNPNELDTSHLWTRPIPAVRTEQVSSLDSQSASNILVPPNISGVLQNPTQTFQSVQLLAQKMPPNTQDSQNFGGYSYDPDRGADSDVIKTSSQHKGAGMNLTKALKRKRPLTNEDVKKNHSNREKRRRQELNRGLEDLKELLPARNRSKETKTDLIADAVSYVTEMREALAQVMEERNRLDGEVMALKDVISRIVARTGLTLEVLTGQEEAPQDSAASDHL